MYASEIGSGDLIDIPSFMTTCFGIGVILRVMRVGVRLYQRRTLENLAISSAKNKPLRLLRH
jgi:hypothetical protein